MKRVERKHPQHIDVRSEDVDLRLCSVLTSHIHPHEHGDSALGSIEHSCGCNYHPNNRRPQKFALPSATRPPTPKARLPHTPCAVEPNFPSVCDCAGACQITGVSPTQCRNETGGRWAHTRCTRATTHTRRHAHTDTASSVRPAVLPIAPQSKNALPPRASYHVARERGSRDDW